MKRPRIEKRRKATLAMRVPEDLHDKVKATAERNGRSITQELEKRLQASFSRDDDGERTDKFIELIRSVILSSEAATGQSWLEDHVTWSNVKEAVASAISQREPSDPTRDKAKALDNDLRGLAAIIDAIHLQSASMDRAQRDAVEKLWHQKTRLIDKLDGAPTDESDAVGN